jgi:hypothetical protein
MTSYPDMHLVGADGIGEEGHSIEVHVNVQMTTRSVWATARWGQTIGTSGMSDCVGRILINDKGAWLGHFLCTDQNERDEEREFRGDKLPKLARALTGDKYPSRGWSSGRSSFAFVLDSSENYQIYVSMPPAPIIVARPQNTVAEGYTDFDAIFKRLGV